MFRGTQCLESAKHPELSIGSLRDAVRVLGPGEIITDDETNQPDLIHYIEDLLPEFGPREEVNPSPLLIEEEDLRLLYIILHKVPVCILCHLLQLSIGEVGLVRKGKVIPGPLGDWSIPICFI